MGTKAWVKATQERRALMEFLAGNASLSSALPLLESPDGLLLAAGFGCYHSPVLLSWE